MSEKKEEEVKPKKPSAASLPIKTTARRLPRPLIRPAWPSRWEDMDRRVEEFKRGFADLFWPRIFPMAPALPEVREPFYDLLDEGKAYRLRVEVPGIPKEKIEIHATGDSIEVNGEATVEEEEKRGGKVISKERSYSRLYRCISLPEEVLPEKTEAALKEGILEIKVPKKTPTPEPKKHRIKVK